MEEPTNHFEPFGDEWEKEIMQFTKKALVNLYRQSCISHNMLKEKFDKLTP